MEGEGWWDGESARHSSIQLHLLGLAMLCNVFMVHIHRHNTLYMYLYCSFITWLCALVHAHICHTQLNRSVWSRTQLADSRRGGQFFPSPVPSSLTLPTIPRRWQVQYYCTKLSPLPLFRDTDSATCCALHRQGWRNRGGGAGPALAGPILILSLKILVS